MLRALRDIVDAGTAIPVRVGVNRGDVFAGDIGPALRRTYTVMGDTVNLAARLMAKATPGEIFAAPSVCDRSRARFQLTPLEPFLVKGKALPVQAFAVGSLESLPQAGSEPDGAVHLPLIGRQEELGRLCSAVDQAAQGMGGLIEVVGDAGLGKTRLLRELRAYGEAKIDGLSQFHMACEPYESSNPYSALRSWIHRILGLDRALSPAARAAQVLSTLENADAALVPWTPLFGVLIDADLADTPQTAALEAKFRPAQLGEVTARLIAKTTTQPLLVTIEDTHWMDDASADLLGHIARGTGEAPVLICTTRRLDETGYRADPESSIGLTALNDVYAAQLIRQASEGHPMSPHAAAALVQRAGGNPLYLTELAAAVGTSDVGALPDSIEALITARIDRLPPQDRHTLRQASVLGRTFPLDWLEALVGRSASAIWDRLGAFLLIESEGIAGFDHALIRDAAYEGLPYRVRRKLHAEVADIIRSTTEKGGENRSGLLSLHYLHAGLYAEAWANARQAAGRAQDAYANLEAAELYERAIDAAGHLSGMPAVELAGVHESLGDVRERFGAYTEAESSYKTARRLAGDDRLGRARLHNKMALVQGWLDRYSQALGTLTRGIHLLDGDESPEANRMTARLSAAYAGLCEEEGHHRKAVKWCRRAIAAAEVSGEREALANALRILDWSLAEMGGNDSPDNVRRALSIYEEMDDLPGQANALNILGGLCYWRGDWPAAAGAYERARGIAERTGNTMLATVLGANMAEILLDQGRVEEAAELFAEASHVARAAHAGALAAFCECNLARARSRQGRHDEAIELFDGAIAEAEAIGRMHEALESRARKAECLLISGQVTEALDLANTTLELAESLGGAPQGPLLHRIRAVAHDRLGDRASATQAIAASLDAARTRAAEYEVALSQLAEADIIRRGGAEPLADLEKDSQEILGRLGVLSTPALYG
jgi:predicted ATPase